MATRTPKDEIQSPTAIDELDRRLVEALRRNGRATNRALGRELGVAQTTVAARIRRLSERGIMRVVLVSDMAAVGYDLMMMLGVRVARRAATDVAKELAEIKEVIGLGGVFGRFDLYVTLATRDRSHLLKILEEKIAPIRGIESVESEFVLDVVLYRAEIAALRNIRTEDVPTSPGVLDEVDQRIIAELRVDGRKSFREVARRLGVSEGTVRLRIRQMESKRAIRFVTVNDPEAFGVRCIAYVTLKVRHGAARAVAKAVAEIPEISFVTITLGRFDVVALALVPDRDRLAALVTNRLTKLRDVQRVETMEVVSLVKHDHHVGRIS